MDFGFLKSMKERVDAYPDCSSLLCIKLLLEERQSFANKLIILCKQCTRNT